MECPWDLPPLVTPTVELPASDIPARARRAVRKRDDRMRRRLAPDDAFEQFGALRGVQRIAEMPASDGNKRDRELGRMHRPPIARDADVQSRAEDSASDRPWRIMLGNRNVEAVRL